MRRVSHRPIVGAALLSLIGCASTPPPPDWQLNAKSAADQAIEATLSGDARRAAPAWDRARAEIARTGRMDLLVRLELMQCATRAASLDFATCERFETLRRDADAPEVAYADYLAAEIGGDRVDHLPPAQRKVARADPAGAASVLAGIEDPFARLVAAAVLLRRGLAGPAVMRIASDTASAQGWRRPLLAWLQALAVRAEQAGDAAEAARLRRRIELVLEGR